MITREEIERESRKYKVDLYPEKVYIYYLNMLKNVRSCDKKQRVQ